MIHYAEYRVDGGVGVVRGIEAGDPPDARVLAERLAWVATELTNRPWELVRIHDAFPDSFVYSRQTIRCEEDIARAFRRIDAGKLRGGPR